MPTTAASRAAAGTTPDAAKRKALLLLAAIGLGMAAISSCDCVSWRAVGLNYEWLAAYAASHTAPAAAWFVLLHVAVVALGLPGGGVLAVTAGLLFGWQLGVAAALAGAVAGAVLLLVVARGPLQGALLAGRARIWVDRLRGGLERDGISYLVVLRLIGLPGAVVNLGAAAVGMRLKPFIIGTVIGILPPIMAFAYLGNAVAGGIAAQNAGFRLCAAAHPLDADAACPYGIDWSAFPAQQLFLAIGLLAGIALLPVIIRKRSPRHVAV